MKKRFAMLILMLMTILFGCKGEDGEDGKDGRVYVVIDWTSDIEALDVSQFFFEETDVIYKNTRYRLKPGSTGYAYWMSNGTTYRCFSQMPEADPGEKADKGKTNFLVPKDGEDGKPGRDLIIYTLVSGLSIEQTGYEYENRIRNVGNNDFEEDNTLQEFHKIGRDDVIYEGYCPQ